MLQIMPLVGIAVMIGLCLVFSKNRKLALERWPLIAWGLALQFLFALFVLRTDVGKWFFRTLDGFFNAVLNCTMAGSKFVFGNLADPSAGMGFFFAFNVLPSIIFFSALTALLYQLGILQKIVQALAWVMAVTMKTSGAETLSASANIFLGQTEAPLLVRPFVPKFTMSEMMVVMAGGFGTVAGGVMAAYVGMLREQIPGIAGHLMAVSVMATPACVMFGKLLVPEDAVPETAGKISLHMPKAYDGVVDSVAGGTEEGVKLAINVGGMLIGFMALIKMLDLIFGSVGGVVHWATEGGYSFQESWTLKVIVGYIFAPFAFLMGIPWAEAVPTGQLLGVKMIANEFVAYGDLQTMGAELSPRTRLFLTYALCGFANLGSIGIQIGGLGIMAPERRADIARLGFAAMMAGTLATNCSGCIALLLYGGEPTPASPVVKFEARSPNATDALVSWDSENTEEFDVFVWEQGEKTPAAPTMEVSRTEKNRSRVGTTLQDLTPGKTYEWQVVASGGKEKEPLKGIVWSFTVPAHEEKKPESVPAPAGS